jgi:uncharacterized OsmC-like protein
MKSLLFALFCITRLFGCSKADVVNNLEDMNQKYQKCMDANHGDSNRCANRILSSNKLKHHHNHSQLTPEQKRLWNRKDDD